MKYVPAAVLVLVLGCGPKTEAPVSPPEAATEAPSAFTPSPSQEALYRALSLRDAELDCKALEAKSDTLVDDLVVIADQAKMPPWAAIRATHCLSSHHAEASREHLSRWLAAKETAGLAQTILANIDDMPESIALDLGRSALDGPSAELTRTALARSERATLRALIDTPTPPETTP